MEKLTGQLRLWQQWQILFIAVLSMLTCLGAWGVVDVVGQTTATDKANSTDDWPGFLGPKRNSISDQQGILTDWSNGNLKTVWESEIGLGYVLGSVSDGRFYQFDAVGEKCRLICKAAKTGKVIWKHAYDFEYKDLFGFDKGPRATPLVDGDRVYTFGVEGTLQCLNTKTGDVIWQADTSRQFGVVQNFFGVGSSPLISGDHLLVMIGGSPEEDQAKSGKRIDGVSPNGSAVVVFNKLDGTLVRKIGNDLASYSSLQTYEKNGKNFCVAWLRENLIGFDADAGKVAWTFPYRARKYESVNASTPVVDGTRIFVSESYELGSLLLDVAKDKPEVIWRDPNRRQWSLALHWNTPVLHEGHLYASHGESPGNAEIRCVEFETGVVKWKQRGYGRASITLVDGKLVVLDERGQLLLVKASPEKFEIVSEYSSADGERLPLQSPCWAAPVIANGLLYVRGKSKLICLQITP